ncbi:MAG TPA: hypothetical protein VGI60_11110 [Chthoniobacterales bacterium]|jgi:YVTN family beta-propeller protein
MQRKIRGLARGALILLAAVSLFAQGPAIMAVGLVKTITVAHDPTQMVTDPAAHNVYVLNHNSNSVSILDSEQLTLKKTLAVGTAPSAIAANPPAGMVYVANSTAGTVSAIKGTRVSATWTVGGNLIGLVVDSALDQLYVADASGNRVVILDGTEGTVLKTLSTTAHPAVMAVNIATHAVFVACTGATGSVVVIDGSAKQVVKTITNLPAAPTSIAIDPATNVANIASPVANVHTVINAANNYSVTQQSGDSGAKPNAIAFDPGGTGLFFIADTGDGDVFFADGSGIVTLGNAYITQESGSNALAVNPSTNQMALAYPSGDFVVLVDLLNPLFDDNYHLLIAGNNTTGLAFDPLTNKLFVSNAGDNTVSVFDVTPTVSVPAYEGDHSGNSIGYNYSDSNPATGMTYTLRLGALYAINEAAAGAGANGMGGNSTGVTTIPLGSVYSEAVAVNAATNKIYVSDGGGLFYSINGATNVATALTILPPTADIHSIAVDNASNKILLWDQVNNSVYVLDGTTEALLKTIAVTPVTSAGLFVDPVKDLAYFACNATEVIDPNAGTVVATIPTSGQELVAAYNASNSRLYIADVGQLYIVDTTQNTIIVTIPVLGASATSAAIDPVTNNFYLGTVPGDGTYHLLEYSGTTNALLTDISSATHPELSGIYGLTANPLTNKMCAGTITSFGSTTQVALVDGNTSAISVLPPGIFEQAAYSISIDLGTGVLGAGGYSYTTLWFPTTDVSGGETVPISVAMTGMRDSLTIATKPIFRTRNTTPSFTITATSKFPQSASALVPTHGFYQVDGWQGAWTAISLKPKVGGITSMAKLTLPTLTAGRHILYTYAADGDVATVQAGNSPNSPVISPVASVTFTVEK